MYRGNIKRGSIYRGTIYTGTIYTALYTGALYIRALYAWTSHIGALYRGAIYIVLAVLDEIVDHVIGPQLRRLDIWGHYMKGTTYRSITYRALFNIGLKALFCIAEVN